MDRYLSTLRRSRRPWFGIALAVVSPAVVASAGPLAPETPAASEAIEFGGDLDRALADAAQDGRPVVVVFGAAWCPACSRFRERALSSEDVTSLGGEFHWVYADVDRDLALARKYEVDATPRTIVVGKEGQPLAAVTGALDGADFRAFLEAARAPDAAQRPSGLGGTDATQLTWNPSGYRALAVCFSQIGYGPLHLPSQAPGQVLRLGLRPRTPSTLAQGQFELVWTETFANVFAYEEDDFRLDYLTLNSNLGLDYGITDTVGIGLAFGNLIRTDSFLDPITTGFHDLFGFDSSGRDEFPEGENVVDFDLSDDIDSADTEGGSEASNLTLSLQHNLTCGTDVWPALAYSISGRWDAGGNADLGGGPPFSVGVSVSAARRLGSELYTYLALGYTWHGQDESRDLDLVNEQWSVLAALEWRYDDNTSFVLQYLANQGVAVDREPFDEPSNELDVGWVWEFTPGAVFETGLIENLVEADNSPDFGLHFGLRYRF